MLLLAVVTLDGTAAAKKRGKGRKKSPAAVEPLKCGVCHAAVQSIMEEVTKEDGQRGGRKGEARPRSGQGRERGSGGEVGSCAGYATAPQKQALSLSDANLVCGPQVRKKENDTTTLDLRWGLTAEVKEGKARRLGKVSTLFCGLVSVLRRRYGWGCPTPPHRSNVL